MDELPPPEPAPVRLKLKGDRKFIDRNIAASVDAFQDRHKPIYAHPLVFKSALRERRPHKKKEEEEKELVEYAINTLNKVNFDSEAKAGKEADTLIREYQERIRKDNRTKFAQNPNSLEGIKERVEIMQNKFSHINKKLNESISKNVASFVATSFTQDAYCKREHLAKVTFKHH